MSGPTNKPLIRRPHRSNAPTFCARSAAIKRSLRPPKRIYYTKAKLRKMLARVMKTDRQRWFADHLRALRSWPERSREENLEAAARVNPQRLMNTGGLAEVALSIELEALVSAPEDGIDVDELRKVLSELDNRQGDRFLKLLVERMPVPRGTPTGWDTRVLMKIRRAHKRMMASLASDPENHVLGSWLREIDLTEGAKVPIPHSYAEIRKKISG